MALLGLREEVLSSDTIWLCSTCFTCHERCPQDVRITELFDALRNIAVRAGQVSPSLRASVDLVRDHGRLIAIGEFDNERRVELGLPAIEERPKELAGILQATGVSALGNPPAAAEGGQGQMKYALFLGCTVPIRNMNYELSTRKVAEKLGIEFVDSNDFACCGFPLKGMDQHTALLMAARNLATAEAMGLDICALCTACSVTLTEANKQLCDNVELRAQVNKELVAAGGKEYQGTIKVRHIARALYEGVGVAGLESAVKTKLSGFKFAAQYGCHYMKPSEVFEGFEDPENPKTLDALIQATGAEAVDYATKLECCGGGILAADEQIALAMPYAKLNELKKLGADAMVLVCPFCDVMYEYNQRRIEKAFSATLQMPVLFYRKCWGLALGITRGGAWFQVESRQDKGTEPKAGGIGDLTPPRRRETRACGHSTWMCQRR